MFLFGCWLSVLSSTQAPPLGLESKPEKDPRSINLGSTWINWIETPQHRSIAQWLLVYFPSFQRGWNAWEVFQTQLVPSRGTLKYSGPPTMSSFTSDGRLARQQMRPNDRIDGHRPIADASRDASRSSVGVATCNRFQLMFVASVSDHCQKETSYKCLLLPALVTCTAQLVNLQLPLWRGTGGTPCVSCRGDEVEDDLQHGTMDAASLVL